MTETRFYEPARLSTPVKPLFSLKPLDATTWLRSLLSKVFRVPRYDPRNLCESYRRVQFQNTVFCSFAIQTSRLDKTVARRGSVNCHSSHITPVEGTFSKSASPILGRLPLPPGRQRLRNQKCHTAVIKITTRSVTNTPRKKPPVPDNLGFFTAGHTVFWPFSAEGLHCDNLVFLHAWHQEVTSRTARDVTIFTNWSRGHGSPHRGILYFTTVS